MSAWAWSRASLRYPCGMESSVFGLVSVQLVELAFLSRSSETFWLTVALLWLAARDDFEELALSDIMN